MDTSELPTRHPPLKRVRVDKQVYRTFLEALGENIRAARVRKRIAYREIARAVGIPRGTYLNLEQGGHPGVTLHVLIAICIILELDLPSILDVQFTHDLDPYVLAPPSGIVAPTYIHNIVDRLEQLEQRRRPFGQPLKRKDKPADSESEPPVELAPASVIQDPPIRRSDLTVEPLEMPVDVEAGVDAKFSRSGPPLPSPVQIVPVPDLSPLLEKNMGLTSVQMSGPQLSKAQALFLSRNLRLALDGKLPALDENSYILSVEELSMTARVSRRYLQALLDYGDEHLLAATTATATSASLPDPEFPLPTLFVVESLAQAYGLSDDDLLKPPEKKRAAVNMTFAEPKSKSKPRPAPKPKRPRDVEMTIGPKQPDIKSTLLSRPAVIPLFSSLDDEDEDDEDKEDENS